MAPVACWTAAVLCTSGSGIPNSCRWYARCSKRGRSRPERHLPKKARPEEVLLEQRLCHQNTSPCLCPFLCFGSFRCFLCFHLCLPCFLPRPVSSIPSGGRLGSSQSWQTDCLGGTTPPSTGLLTVCNKVCNEAVTSMPATEPPPPTGLEAFHDAFAPLPPPWCIVSKRCAWCTARTPRAD